MQLIFFSALTYYLKFCTQLYSQPSSDRPEGARQAQQDMERASVEKRFAYSLLEKLLLYQDNAALKMKTVKPSQGLTRRNSFKQSSQDVKFFSKVSHLSKVTSVPLVSRDMLAQFFCENFCNCNCCNLWVVLMVSVRCNISTPMWQWESNRLLAVHLLHYIQFMLDIRQVTK